MIIIYVIKTNHETLGGSIILCICCNYRNLRQSCDICKDEVTQNLAETIGFLRFLRLALRCQEGGLGLLGTPCNSFGWMSSSQHERSHQNPWGNMGFPWVVLGNVLASRSCLVAAVLVARSVFWMMENPHGSQLPVLPPLQHLMANADMWPLRVYWWGPHFFFNL